MADEIFDFEDGFEEEGVAKRRQDDEKTEVLVTETNSITQIGETDTYSMKVSGDKVSIMHETQGTNTSMPGGLVTPPENFSAVCGDIYRSSFPRTDNFEFLSRLKLKSIICLIPEDYPEENSSFIQDHNIKFFQIGMEGNKEPFVKIQPELIQEALKIVLNPENQPILIHCNRGKHRTGCLVGCIRKLQKWSLSMIFDEYRKFSYPKERPLDQQFIEMFRDEETDRYATARNWLPLKW
ncbi:unnamed protein product [Kuraishia capsulata CBS 1993]|uniref:diphosphoinositol-polyphosphate diphosphatase n=1 Tax=Kuraishia capsulata CBS 1993 TaxID=1382522 RepID=W6MWN9_9ASCO|nr:uncharacterized protein KUCA_T00003674001 [Kuraishia capsulata CBS 1993]CDK27695.1 unnamed protein product [Kuraishia capsulata CBS 1993]